jgi:hypothetical protein
MSEKLRVSLFSMVLAALISVPAHAFDNYAIGHITRASFNTDYILITVDAGVPTNCTGTFSGWMAITASSKLMQAFVTGLWMRGDAADKSMVFYTTGIGSSGFCEISQIDTQSAG